MLKAIPISMSLPCEAELSELDRDIDGAIRKEPSLAVPLVPVRTALYMAAVVASRSNPVIAVHY